MPHAQFDTAQLDGSGTVVVSGPISFAQDEQEVTVVASLDFVLVQDDVFVAGRGSVEGKGRWGGQSNVADKLLARPAQAFGIAVLVRRAQPATATTPARRPVVQTLTWSEAITITS